MHAMTMYYCCYSCKLRFMQRSCLLLVKNINNWSNFKCILQVHIKHARSTIMSTTIFSTLFLKLWKELPIKETKKKLDPLTKITPIARQKNLLMHVGFKDYKILLNFQPLGMNLSTNGQLGVKISSSNMELTLSMVNSFFFIHHGIFICIIHWNCKWNYNHIFLSH